MTKRLYRLPEQGQITGVAAGLADYFTIDPTVVRVLIVALVFLTDGLAILAYFLLALVLPVKGQATSRTSDRFRTMADDASRSWESSSFRNWLGAGLIAIGLWYLLVEFLPELIDISWNIVWPLGLIALGIFILLRRSK